MMKKSNRSNVEECIEVSKFLSKVDLKSKILEDPLSGKLVESVIETLLAGVLCLVMHCGICTVSGLVLNCVFSIKVDVGGC
jgi:hypothetical protein